MKPEVAVDPSPLSTRDAADAPLAPFPAAVGAVTVLLSNALYLSGLSRILDPMLAMDPLYIRRAEQPVTSIVRGDPAWGPLYAVWLKPFVALFGDPVSVYAANLYALSVGVSFLLYVYVLLLTRCAAAGVAAAIVFLVSDLNVPLAGKVSDFALLLVLAGLTVAELVPAGARRLAVTTGGVLLASYVRPELYPSALCLSALALLRARRDPSRRSGAIWPAMMLIATAMLAVWIGTPIFSRGADDDRLLTAFREHFAWNWSDWHGGGWPFSSIWEQQFGTARTILQALRADPIAFGHHLADNLLGTLRFMVGSAFDHFPLLAPAAVPVLVQVENALLAAAVYGSLAFVLARADLRRRMRSRFGHMVLPSLVVAAFPLAASILIFPLARYLIVPAVFVLIAGAMAATVMLPARAGTSRTACVLAAIICLAAVPKPFVLPSAYVVAGAPFKGRITVARTVFDTVAFVHSLALSPPVHVLTFTDGIGEMLGSGFQELKVWQRGERTLEAYIRDEHVDLIVSLEPGQGSFFTDDHYWTTIQNTPDAAGFTRLTVPDEPDVRVYLRTDLVR